MHPPDILPNRLNFDAIVFCGCTMKEMQWIVISSLVVCILLLGFLTKCLFNMFLIGVGIAFPTAVGMSWVIAHIFQRAKQGKPKGYMKQKLLLWGEDKKLFPSIYIRRSGKWSIGKFK
jgi:conjugative transfer region protein (TIGR03750 family)